VVAGQDLQEALDNTVVEHSVVVLGGGEIIGLFLAVLQMLLCIDFSEEVL
jgi:hypothetical protein